MATFKSKYKNLAFYFKGERKKFRNGIYKTNINQEIGKLSRMKNCYRVEEEEEKPEHKQEETDL